MFKKKQSGIRAMHYEGLNMPANYPCEIEIIDGNFVISNRTNSDMKIVLPVNQIKSFSTVGEFEFMEKYHGAALIQPKKNHIKKYFLVVDYSSKAGTDERLVFWGTVSEYKNFLKLQYSADNIPTGETYL